MNALPLSEPSRGAYCDLDQLLALRVLSRRLQVPARISRSAGGGGHRSHARGRGLEFEEVRPYQAGDDVRNIDWRVTARHQTPYTKLFREERERPLLMLVDQRPGMFFGSRYCCKSVLAAQLAALLAWAALGRGDRVGGLVLGADSERRLEPHRSSRTVLALLAAVAEYNQALSAQTPSAPVATGVTGMADSLLEMRRIARPGSSVWLISDLADMDQPEAQRQLQLLARHTRINALWVHDPLELALPERGRLSVTDGSRQLQIDCDNRSLTEGFHRHMTQRRQQLERRLQELGANFIAAATDRSPVSLASALREGLR